MKQKCKCGGEITELLQHLSCKIIEIVSREPDFDIKDVEINIK